MNGTKKSILLAAMVVIGAWAVGPAFAAEINVKLSGDSEVPPVKTSASGAGKIMVGDDGSVSGSVTTKGMMGSMAHIHMAGAGQNGKPVVSLEKQGDTYTVPAGTKLDADQMKAFKAGDLYINVHSPDHKGGEIRGQLK